MQFWQRQRQFCTGCLVSCVLTVRLSVIHAPIHTNSIMDFPALSSCRSVFHWEPVESATQISLSTSLSPPVTLLHATVIIPPLPLLATNSSTPAEAPTQPASQAVSDRQSVQLLVQSDQPLQAAGKQQPSTSSSQQHQGRSPQQEENQQLVDQNVEQLQQQHQPAASAKRKLPRLGSGTVQEAPRQTAKHKSPNRQRQREQQLQSVDRPKGSSGAKPDPNLDPKPGRWLPPVGVRWQGKPRPIPKLSVLIRVQGSVHSMPAQAKLHVMGHHWCKAQLISHTAQHQAASYGPLTAAAQAASAAVMAPEALAMATTPGCSPSSASSPA